MSQDPGVDSVGAGKSRLQVLCSRRRNGSGSRESPRRSGGADGVLEALARGPLQRTGGCGAAAGDRRERGTVEEVAATVAATSMSASQAGAGGSRAARFAFGGHASHVEARPRWRYTIPCVFLPFLLEPVRQARGASMEDRKQHGVDATNREFGRYDQVRKTQLYRLAERTGEEEFDTSYQVRTCDIGRFLHGNVAD